MNVLILDKDQELSCREAELWPGRRWSMYKTNRPPKRDDPSGEPPDPLALG